MSVMMVTEDVNIHVKTLLVAIIVHVILVINHLENIAMVITNYGFDILLFQISMSVIKVKEGVNTHVPTLLVAITVHVILVIHLIKMEKLVLVLLVSLNC